AASAPRGEESARRAAAEQPARRSALLAEASTALSRSLDFEATCQSLARVPVPFLADVSAVVLRQEHGRPGWSEVAWAGQGEPGCVGLDGLPEPLRRAVERVLAEGR